MSPGRRPPRRPPRPRATLLALACYCALLAVKVLTQVRPGNEGRRKKKNDGTDDGDVKEMMPCFPPFLVSLASPSALLAPLFLTVAYWRRIPLPLRRSRSAILEQQTGREHKSELISKKRKKPGRGLPILSSSLSR